MKHINTQLRFTALLLFSLILFGVTPWLNRRSEVEFSLLLLPVALASTFAVIVIWMNIIMMLDLPDGKLLLSAKGKHELLWQLADSKAVNHQGWPWWLKSVAVWLGFGGAFVVMVALGWVQVRFDQDAFFFIVVLGVPTLIASVVFYGRSALIRALGQSAPGRGRAYLENARGAGRARARAGAAVTAIRWDRRVWRKVKREGVESPRYVVDQLEGQVVLKTPERHNPGFATVSYV